MPVAVHCLDLAIRMVARARLRRRSETAIAVPKRVERGSVNHQAVVQLRRRGGCQGTERVGGNAGSGGNSRCVGPLPQTQDGRPRIGRYSLPMSDLCRLIWYALKRPRALDSLSHRPFLCGPGDTQLVRCHFGAFHPGFDFLARDIPRGVRRTMFRLHVDAEGREAAVVR
jgi:hypothetical protein